MGWVVNATPRPLYPQERDPAPNVQEAGWASALVSMGPQNLAPSGPQILDRLTFSESLYRQSHPDRPSLPNAQK